MKTDSIDTELIETGLIVNTHGIHGELRLQPWADSPQHLTAITDIYIDGRPKRVLSARVHKSNIIIKLEGIDSIDSAVVLKNKTVSVRKCDIKLEEGSYFIADLIGLTVIDAEKGTQIGILTDVLTMPAHNVYVIKGEREILVPAVSEFIIETNISEGYIKLRLIDGL